MSERGAALVRLAPLVLVLALAGALLPRAEGALQLASPDASASNAMARALARLPEDPLVVVGFDPDLGTYAEIRATTRVLLAELARRDATLAFISLTPEGRALAIAELARLARTDADLVDLVDLGFIPGAEAALVGLAGALGPGAAGGVVSGLPAATELSGADLGLVIGGNDLGPRSWVEQVGPRTDGLEIVAVAPSVLLPELQPYLASGQLAALLGTPRDGAAYRAAVALESGTGPGRPAGPSPLATLVGMLAAIGVLGQAFGSRLLVGLRAARPREPA